MNFYGREWKSWDQFEPDSNRAGDILREIARHMELAHRASANPGSVGFKAGHQLAHKGWAFPAGVYDVASGVTYPGIKGLRGLIFAGHHDWFEHVSWSQGQVSSPSEVVDPGTRQFVDTVTQGGSFMSFAGRDFVIVMVERSGTPRVAGVIIQDAAKSGLTPHFEAAVTAGSGCVLPAVVLASVLAVVLTGVLT
jgi:hypothetical protein